MYMILKGEYICTSFSCRIRPVSDNTVNFGPPCKEEGKASAHLSPLQTPSVQHKISVWMLLLF